MNTKTKLAIVTLVLIAIAASYFFLIQPNITGSAILDNYTFTKAICDENNFCQDYIIACDGNELTKRTPIQGAVIQHHKDWQDPRGEQSEINLCED